MAISMQRQVIICGGANKPALKQIDKLFDANEVRIFIGVDRGALKLIKRGYHLDVAIGDFDSVTPSEFETIQAHSDRVLVYPSNKDDTDMELALSLALADYPEAEIRIFGALGETRGRLDHLVANLWLVYQPRFSDNMARVQFIETHHLVRYYMPGQHQLDPLAKTNYLSIIGLTALEQLEIQGAKYNLPATDTHYPRALISNEFINKSTPVQLTFAKGMVMVMWVHEIKD